MAESTFLKSLGYDLTVTELDRSQLIDIIRRGHNHLDAYQRFLTQLDVRTINIFRSDSTKDDHQQRSISMFCTEIHNLRSKLFPHNATLQDMVKRAEMQIRQSLDQAVRSHGIARFLKKPAATLVDMESYFRPGQRIAVLVSRDDLEPAGSGMAWRPKVG